MKKKKIKFMVFALFFFSSCSPTRHHSFVKKADIVFEKMCDVLETVEHPQDFNQLVKLSPLYVEIAQIMILSLKAQEKDSHIFENEIIEAPHAEVLKNHLIRLYQMEGGRAACENAARDALILLQKSPYKSLKIDFNFNP